MSVTGVMNSLKELFTRLTNLFSVVFLIYSPHSLFQAPQEALSQMVLAEVPKQLVSYYKWQEWPPLKLPEVKAM